MRKENILDNNPTKNTLGSLTLVYQGIINQPKELNGPRPSIGTALRMDGNIFCLNNLILLV